MTKQILAAAFGALLFAAGSGHAAVSSSDLLDSFLVVKPHLVHKQCVEIKI